MSWLEEGLSEVVLRHGLVPENRDAMITPECGCISPGSLMVGRSAGTGYDVGTYVLRHTNRRISHER
jgi:hypothetical protein